MLRKTNSFLAPIEKTRTEAGSYDLFPAFTVSEPIYKGIGALAEKFQNSQS